MLTFEEEIEKLKPLMDCDADEAYSFLAPLMAEPVKRPVVLYAAGKTCERIYKYLWTKGIQVSAICDKNKQGMFLDSGLTIIPPSELYQNYRNAWIVVCTFNYSVDAIAQLCESGIREKIFFARHIRQILHISAKRNSLRIQVYIKDISMLLNLRAMMWEKVSYWMY